MDPQLSLEKTFLIATWVEGILYGFLFCIFGGTMYLHFSSDYSKVGSKRERHATVMIIISSIMFFIATFHAVMVVIRFLHGFSDELLASEGPGGYLGELRRWDHILKDTLYTTQVNLGSAAAIYRCWTLWNFNWKVVVFPIILLLTNTAVGYVVCGTYPSIEPTASIFNSHITQWIKTLYALAVVLNATITCLLIYRIWAIRKDSASYRLGNCSSIPIVHILIDSAALQLPFEIILLALYAAGLNAQYIMLECITPVVAITFNAITIRLKLHSAAMEVIPLPNNHARKVGGTQPMSKKFQVSVIRECDEEHIHSFKNAS
ncbi:hypothetical protein CVT25_013201 [Psilocybe cyanescens]|uniref:Uncharacterized protein n=1 Tax=Psilocybe cyanescens TaxID=93625 RepID=A0A409XLR5_PSICY|nr:hypothetical protein CVT25_013201 [Psilocybe cyanescens]